LRAAHHLLLSHGYAVEALRANVSCLAQIGIALNLSPVYPATPSEKDQRAAARFDGHINRSFLDPLLKGCYPEDMLRLFKPLFRFVKIMPDDLNRIAAPLDFVGINYYTRAVIRHARYVPILQALPVRPVDSAYSQMWEIYPPGIYELITRVWNDYRPTSIIVTENGIPTPDAPDAAGRVRDEQRIRYMHSHIAQVHRAITKGIPVRGYFAWSILDNFEWNLGYQMRFGLIHVDYATLARTIKDSGRWFSNVIHQNALDNSLLA
jgi:beta-glucosidase